MIHQDLKIKRALISVTDKTDLIPLAKKLVEFGVELISTGGTRKHLEENGFTVTSVESMTKNPESFGGRMKSISFQISSALLFRRHHDGDLQHAAELNIEAIDLVVCNLYPFHLYAGKDSDEDILIENIDIGGPLMLRCAAKNYEGVTVLSSIEDYTSFLREFNGLISFEKRRRFAIETFKRIAEYDVLIAEELSSKFDVDNENTGELQNTVKWLPLKSEKSLRYGENPHQWAKLYKFKNTKSEKTLFDSEFIQGKELSYNNWIDADAAWRVMSDLAHLNPDKAIVSIIKHANPCGLSVSESSFSSLKEAWEGDSVSSFGGIIAFSSLLDEQCALFLNERFIEVVIAPDYSSEALKILSKKKNVRVLRAQIRNKNESETIVKSISGGLLFQNEDESNGLSEETKQVTIKTFNLLDKDLIDFGIIASKHLKSNAIALVMKTKNGHLTLAGAGMGQPNRLDSLNLLAKERASKKGFELSEMLLISDAFFPFSDSIDVCHEVGIKYIIQPGGSIRDEEVINACDKYNIAMIFTGKRHFRH